jgi:hypothetical protein
MRYTKNKKIVITYDPQEKELKTTWEFNKQKYDAQDFKNFKDMFTRLYMYETHQYRADELIDYDN